jgi:hypothetical protein
MCSMDECVQGPIFSLEGESEVWANRRAGSDWWLKRHQSGGVKQRCD